MLFVKVSKQLMHIFDIWYRVIHININVLILLIGLTNNPNKLFGASYKSLSQLIAEYVGNNEHLGRCRLNSGGAEKH